MNILKTITITLLTTVTILTATTTTTNTAIKEQTTYSNNLQTNEDLTEYATNFLKDIYNIDLEIPVCFNDILEEQKAFGLFRYNTGATTFGAIDIIIDNTMLTKDCEHWIEEILIHELVHYALFTLNIEHEDGAKTFETELKYQYDKSKKQSNLNINCCK